jgi:cytochrome c peroxidase
MKRVLFSSLGLVWVAVMFRVGTGHGCAPRSRDGGQATLRSVKTFGGNGRTCRTCLFSATGTVSPEDAQRRFARNPNDPLFLHDGSDDFQGHGVSRMLTDATVLVEIPLPENVSLADDPSATLGRSSPRYSHHVEHAGARPGADAGRPASRPRGPGGGRDSRSRPGPSQRHREGTRAAGAFERTDAFFSSPALRDFARTKLAPAAARGCDTVGAARQALLRGRRGLSSI